MKKILFTLVALAASVGCQREEPFVESENGQESSGPVFTAQVEAFSTETRTGLDGNSLVWSSADQLAIFQGRDIADKYQVEDESIGSRNGTFSIVANGEGISSVDFDANIAVYPYEDNLTCTPTIVDGNVTSYTITGVTIPSVQTYVPGSFSEESFLMAAITNGLNDTGLNFKNLCGILHLQLTGTANVKSIEICGNDNEKLSGDATITISKGAAPSLEMSESAGTTVLLDCGEGVQLSENEETLFYITVPPTAFEKGFHMVVKDVDGRIDRVATIEGNSVGRSYIHTMPNILTETEEPSMICYINGNYIYVRAKSFDDQNDIYWMTEKISKSYNGFFNLRSISTCPTTNADNKPTANNKLWKSTSDDICPIQVWGEHVGGNHGYNCVDKLTVPDHGKTDADIGSVWTDSGGNTYVLVFVYDANTLGVVRYNEEMKTTGKMECKAGVDTPLSHKSGATNTAAISVKSQSKEQLRICSNNHSLKLYVDGIEKDLNTNAIYHGDRIEFLAVYDVIFVPAMLEYLMANVGKNTKDSQHDEKIQDHYYRLSTRYQFNRNGSITQYHTYTIYKTFDVGYGGLVQSGRFAENDPKNTSYIGNPYIYTPDTIYDDLICHNTTDTEYKMFQNTWRDSNKVPYRYFQFSDDKADKGMCLAYDRSVGWGLNEERLKHIDVKNNGYAGRYRQNTKKMYPAFFCGGGFKAGLSFDGVACRIPLRKHDEDLTAMGWYWLGDDIVLMIDSHKAVDKDIFLPAYMNGMQIEVLDRTGSVECVQSHISDRKLRYNTNGSTKDYLVLKLSK